MEKSNIKTTRKPVLIGLVIGGTLLYILFFVGMFYLMFKLDTSVHTDFEKNQYGEIIVDNNVKIYGTSGLYLDSVESYYVQGYLENNNNYHDIEFVTVEYNVYDMSNTLLGTADAYIEVVNSNTKWKFKAIYSGIDASKVSRYELSKVEFY